MATPSKREEAWRNEGLEPLPLDAPAYRVIPGSPLTTFWIAGYHPTRWDVQHLDPRYTLDHTTMPAPDPDEGFGRVRRGDVIIWVGPGKAGSGIEDLIWQPSLVVDSRGAGDGLVRISSLRDTSLEELPVNEVSLPGIDLRSHIDGQRHPQSVDSSVLDLWGLNVWCPACGHLGSITTVGLMPEPRTRDLEGNLLPWPEGLTIDSGCVPDTFPQPYACTRCDHEWGGSSADPSAASPVGGHQSD